MLGSSWWGQGFGKETAEALLKRVTALGGIQLVWATVHPDNVRCKRLLARLDFTRADIDDAPDLGSYDPGDDVYVLSTGVGSPAA